jgi:hypothetical protein
VITFSGRLPVFEVGKKLSPDRSVANLFNRRQTLPEDVFKPAKEKSALKEQTLSTNGP